jgi:hypothetical protein
MGTRVKWLGHEADHSLLSSATLIIGSGVSQLAHRFSWRYTWVQRQHAILHVAIRNTMKQNNQKEIATRKHNVYFLD